MMRQSDSRPLQRRRAKHASSADRSRFGDVSRSRTAFFLAIGLLAVVFLGGGASRTDVYSLLYVRPISAIILVVLLFNLRRSDVALVRTPFLLLLGLSALIAIQLVPLPPALWLSLPGRSNFAEAAAAIGLQQPWRPLTLTPDMAWNSLLDMVPPLAGLTAVASMNDAHRWSLITVLLGGIIVSMLVGIMQVTGGPTSPAFAYRVTHEGSAVGLLANRNHQAALLALAFPLLRMWTLRPVGSREQAHLRLWIAIGLGLVLVPLILITGSRAGLVLALVGMAGALFVKPSSRKLLGAARNRGRRFVTLAAALLISVGAGLSLFFGRALAIDRLTDIDLLKEEPRFRNTGLVFDIIRDFFPFGAGFGSFDQIFKVYEPDRWLEPRYYNRAHNDLLELVLTGGLPALVLLVLFVVWWLRAGVWAFFGHRNPAEAVSQARGAWLMILVLMLASLVDYPLRTQLLATVFAISAGWLSVYRTARVSDRRSLQEALEP